MSRAAKYIIFTILVVTLNVLGVWFPWIVLLVNTATPLVVLWLLYRLHNITEGNMQKSATMLSEAGNAITDTLKIAFENLKKVSGNITKAQGKISDHEARLHRLEQGTQRAAGISARHEAIKNVERIKKDDESAKPTRPTRQLRDADNTEET